MVGTSNVRRCVIFCIVRLRERVGESATIAAIADAAPIGVHGLAEASEVSEEIIHSLFSVTCGAIGEDILEIGYDTSYGIYHTLCAPPKPPSF